jgi:hypothetical protein
MFKMFLGMADERRVYSIRRSGLKTIFYIFLLIFSVFLVDFIFGWSTVEKIPQILKPYSRIILLINPYLLYIQAILILIFGYLAVNVVSGLIYAYFLELTDHPTAAAIRSISRISGTAILISLVASVFNVNPTAALTVGSFGGLVVGFATQTILSHIVAGIFLLIARPFVYGETITVSGYTGIVKEIKLMHLILETGDGSKHILIPSGSVVSQVIQKKRDEGRQIITRLILDPIPEKVSLDMEIEFTGRLEESPSMTPLLGMRVEIMEKDIGRDDLLASGTTDEGGRYSIPWNVTMVDWIDETMEIYAKFEGTKRYRDSKSEVQIITLTRKI